MDGVLYTYYYEGGKLMKMTIGDITTMDFFYDQYGRPFAVKHNTRMLYYVLNEQGDVTRLIHGNGDGYATYHYDAWGNITYATDNQFTRDNPLRYRGYVYDTETGLYYVSSRYYDPEIGRFINADAVDLLGANGDFASLNLFAYCGNNPVSRTDSNGHFWNVVIGATVGGLVSGITTAIDSFTSTGSVDWGAVGISTAVGAVSGGVAATGLGVFVQAGWSAVASAVGSVATDLYERSKNPNAGKVTLKEFGGMAMRAVESAVIGFGSSLIGSGAGRAVSMGLESKGATMVLSSKGTAYWTRAKAKNLANQGKALINTAHGISSVVGTVFTWPTATALSLNL